MKHLKLFESRTLDLILNIARDEGLPIADKKTCDYYDWDHSEGEVYIDRYPIGDDAGNMDFNNPIMDTKQFIRIVRDIDQRLKMEGLLNAPSKLSYVVPNGSSEPTYIYVPMDSETVTVTERTAKGGVKIEDTNITYALFYFKRNI